MPYRWDSEYRSHLKDERPIRLTEAMNHKNQFIGLCQQMSTARGGWTTPQTRLYGCRSEVDLKMLPPSDFPLFFKPALGATGIGVERCGSPAELEYRLCQFTDKEPLQLQAAVKMEEEGTAPEFASVNFFTHENGEVSWLGATRQILKGNVHEGNEYPLLEKDEAALWELCTPVAHHISAEGMQGFFGLDVARDQELGWVLIECNARATGATTPILLAQRLGAPCWRSSMVKVKADTLDSLRFDDLPFGGGRGIALSNPLIISVGKVGIISMGHCPEEVRKYEQRFRQMNER